MPIPSHRPGSKVSRPDRPAIARVINKSLGGVEHVREVVNIDSLSCVRGQVKAGHIVAEKSRQGRKIWRLPFASIGVDEQAFARLCDVEGDCVCAAETDVVETIPREVRVERLLKGGVVNIGYLFDLVKSARHISVQNAD